MKIKLICILTKYRSRYPQNSRLSWFYSFLSSKEQQELDIYWVFNQQVSLIKVKFCYRVGSTMAPNSHSSAGPPVPIASSVSTIVPSTPGIPVDNSEGAINVSL